MTGQIISHYRILEKLGEGGMGVVYKAEDTKLRRTVALKILAPTGDGSGRQRFLREAQAAAALNHPNICTIYEVDEQHGFLAMELVEGPSLKDKICERPLRLDDAIDLAAQIAAGLQAAHDKGVTHRDIKPANILLTGEGRLKITDFGLAALAGSTRITKTGTSMGTPAYMSPEQARGEPLDRRTDLWSAAAVFYEMLTGRPPFSGDTEQAVTYGIIHTEPEPPTALRSGLPLEIDRIIAKALAKNPGERYQHAEDFLVDLRRLKRDAESRDNAWNTVASRAWRRRAIIAAPVLAAASFWAGRRTARISHPSFQRLTFGRGSIWAARFASDGQTIIYSARWDGNPPEVFLTRRDNSESRPILAGAELLSVSANGELAVLLDATLVDPFKRLGTVATIPIAGGSPREVAERAGGADWEPGHGRLALLRGQSALEYPAGHLIHPPTGPVSHVRFSRNGDRIAFLQHVNTDDGAVAVYSLRDQRTEVLSDGWQSVWGLAWSPAGDELWLTGSRTGGGRALYALTPSGRLQLRFRETGSLTLHDVAYDGRVLIAQDDLRGGVLVLRKGSSDEQEMGVGSCLSVDLSPDGSAVLWEGWDPRTGSSAVCLRKIDGSPPVRLGEGVARALSPDGKWALALDSPSRGNLILHPTGPGQSRQLGNGLVYLEASWFPDSRRILAFARESGKRGIYVIDASEGQPRLVAQDATLHMRMHPVSPDAKSFFARARDGRYYVFPIEGGSPRLVPGIAQGEVPARWTPDGRSIFVQTRNRSPARLSTIEVATGHRTIEREFVQRDRAGVLPGSLLPSADGQVYAFQYARWLSDLYLMDPT